ncbi:MAG: glycosyltransferase [Candidatus Gottesmanbacteria bacterium]|nr:glycosyltransferase [Candidatus Gottesmanbacteria bacterium]
MRLTDLSIILPTLNEQGNILPLIRTINQRYHPLEILIVDDNSTDGTGALVKQYMGKKKTVTLIENNPPLGLTASLQQGIDSAKGKFVLWMDADFSHPPEIIGSMTEQIQNADIVVGSWLTPGGEDNREMIVKLFSRMINVVCQICFGKSIHAYTSGFILVRKSVFKDFRLKGDYGEYCIYFLAKQQAMGRKIVEVPFACVSRQNGKTKTAPNISVFLKHGAGYVKTIIFLLVSINIYKIQRSVLNRG